MANRILLPTAIQIVRNWFSDTSVDIMQVTDIYKLIGRDNLPEEKNKIWMRNKLTDLKFYNLVQPEYKEQSLVSVRLTERGKNIVRNTNQQQSVLTKKKETIQDTSDRMLVLLTETFTAVEKLALRTTKKVSIEVDLKYEIVSIHVA